MVAIIARLVVLMFDLTFTRWATTFVMETNNRFIMSWVKRVPKDKADTAMSIRL